MDGGADVREFLERAGREAERYGEDPWILLRELVQNSRDAGAGVVQFSATADGSDEVLSCVDDGAGMSRGDVERYLLRLYASGKDANKPRKGARAMAGKFGVGFWSVLRFEPTYILVETNDGSGASAVEVDCVSARVREVPPTDPPARGTRVSLRRPRRPEPLDAAVREGIIRWASHVRGVDGGAPPQLLLAGEVINRPFPRPRLIAEEIRDRGFTGVVGFGSAPDIRLYAHGLLVKEAGSLEELLPKRRARPPREAPGLYPVCFLNADSLEVLMDRSSVIEDAVLERVVRVTERRLHRLRLRLLDEMGPLPLVDKIRLKVVRPSVIAGALVALLAFGGGIAGARLLSFESPPELPVSAPPAVGPPRTFGPDLLSREAPRISAFKSGDALPWDIRVSDPQLRLLKLATFARYKRDQGLVRSTPEVAGPARLESARGRDVSVEFGADSPRDDAPLVLPVPTGGAALTPVTVDGVAAPVFQTGRGEPVVQLKAGPHVISYRFRDGTSGGPRPAVEETARRFPKRMKAWVDQARRLPRASRPAHLAGRVAAAFTYTTAFDDAARFDATRGDFLERVDRFGRGDCDVLNAVLVILLRAVDIPAQLAVGLVVEDHAAARELHAWAEHWDAGTRRWSTLDVTPATLVPRATPRPASALPPTPQPPPDTPTAAATAEPVAEPPPESPEPTPILSARRRDELKRALPFALVLVLVSALALVVLVYRRGRGRHDIPRDDPALIEMLRQFLKNRSGTDPMHLARRRFFRTAGGHALSIQRLDEVSWAGPLLTCAPTSPALPHVVTEEVLDSTDGLLRAVRDLLPDAVDLDELTAHARPPSDPAVRIFARAVHCLDPECTVSERDGDDVLEARVRSRNAARLNPRHIVIGVDGLPPASNDDAARALTVARGVLARTTLFRDQPDRLLALVAHEALFSEDVS